MRYRVTTAESGQTTGLECVVMPLWRARRSGDAAHPLALGKRELVTLLRLIEALFAPGWGAGATSAGLLALHGGKGSATDRLALLLLVLQAGPDGRVRMVGGPVPKGRGRAAATVARLLGCSVAGGGKVLARLRFYGVVDTVRVQTGSGLFGKGRLVVPAVAAAHAGRDLDAEQVLPEQDSTLGDTKVVCGRCALQVENDDPAGAQAHGEDSEGDVPEAPDRGGVAPNDQRSDGAPGDLEPDRVSDAHGNAGEAAAAAGGGAEVAERPDATPLHTHHPSRVDLSEDGASNRCFSGAAAGGCGSRPERAPAREDAHRSEAELTAADMALEGADGPLRGEQRDQFRADSDQSNQLDASRQVLDAWTAKAGGPPLVWASVPKGLESVLAPVAMVWGRLERLGARHRVTAAVHAELTQLRGVFGPSKAEKILTDRLRRRMTSQGQVPVADPVGWLIGRALPRRSSCYDPRCDEGRRMDTGTECDACQLLHADRRALRHAVSAELSADLASNPLGVERKELFEDRLREKVAAEGWRRAARHQQDATDRAAREAAAASRRAQLEATEATRRARPCAVCGRGNAGGLCGICRNGQTVEQVIAEAVDTAVASGEGPVNSVGQSEIASRVETQIRAEVEQAEALGRSQGADEEAASLMGRLAAELTAAEGRRFALAKFARGPEACAEAEAAFDAQLRRRHLHESEDKALEAAREAGAVARWRAAEHLMTTRTVAVRARRAAPPEPREPDPYTLAAARVRAQIRRPRTMAGA
ncbi:hypothetical protein [Streptomyces sp. NPDC002402]